MELLYPRSTIIEPSNYEDSLNFVFANTQEVEGIYLLTTVEIAAAQETDKSFQTTLKKDKKEKYVKQSVGDIEAYCCNGKLVIPKSLQRRAVEWYHHYLQHPGSTRLEETLKGSMYWKGMRTTVRAYVKNCLKCQRNKKTEKKFGKLPTKYK